MNPLSFISPDYYAAIFTVAVMLMAVATAVHYGSSQGNTILHAEPSMPVVPVLLTIVIVAMMTNRPPFYGDTGNYRYGYENFMGTDAFLYGAEAERLWALIGYVCYNAGLDWRMWLLVIATAYVGCTLVACRRFFPNNVWIAFLFCLASFSFWSYGTNGIRNGMATSMVLLGLSFLMSRKWPSWMVGIVIMAAATEIHTSVKLPVCASILAMVLWRRPQLAFYLWVLSIPISLVAGNAIGGLFADSYDDQRMQAYFAAQGDEELMESFSQTGFRWDFLLYGCFPVLFTWYLTVKRRFEDRGFNILAITYIVANAFWIMVIRASFSNRFACLSWFLYPIVIAYPLLRFNIWDDQDKKTAIILALYEAFTFAMFLRDL